jgi:hypothetical protein
MKDPNQITMKIPPQIKKPPQVSEVIDLTARRPGQGEQKSHPSNWGK